MNVVDDRIHVKLNELIELASFQENKITCGRCRIHCYKPDMKEKVKTIMRYSGPRMLWHHPVLALHHAIDGFKSPDKAKASSSAHLI